MKHVVLVIALASLSCATKQKPELTSSSSPKSLVSTDVAQLELPRYPGLEPWSLSSLRGKVVLVDVWATWCDPCRESLPLYEDLYKEFGPQGFEVITISVDENPELITPFMAETKVKLPVVVDPGAKVAGTRLKVSQLPTAFLVDRKGVIRIVHEGFDEGLLSTWLDEIQTLLAEKP